MTVLEPGPGMGFFTIELARRAGTCGRVIAVDIQPKMLSGLGRRAAKAGLGDRIEARLAASASMAIGDLRDKVDFVLAFAVVHEMPSDEKFFVETSEALKTGGTLLLAEPSGHVTAEAFAEELTHAGSAGLEVVAHPAIRRSRSALLRKI